MFFPCAGNLSTILCIVEKVLDRGLGRESGSGRATSVAPVGADRMLSFMSSGKTPCASQCLTWLSEIFHVNLEAQELEGHGSLRSRFAAAASRHWDRTDRSCEITLCEALCGLAWLSDSF